MFPEASVALHSTVVVPIGKTDPDGGSVVTVAEQLSETITSKLTTAKSRVSSAFTTTVPGDCIIGDSSSVTVTVNEHVE